jgi:hypothetical protein
MIQATMNKMHATKKSFGSIVIGSIGGSFVLAPLRKCHHDIIFYVGSYIVSGTKKFPPKFLSGAK